MLILLFHNDKQKHLPCRHRRCHRLQHAVEPQNEGWRGLPHCLASERNGLVEGPVFLRADKVYSLGWMASAAPITTEGILEGIKVHVPSAFARP